MCPVRECGYVEWMKPGQQQVTQPESNTYQTSPTSTDFILDKLASIENLLAGILRAVEKNESTLQPGTESGDASNSGR